MKYRYFKIINFSTTLKKIDRIKGSFLRIYKNIKYIPNNLSNKFNSIIKYFFSGINKNAKFATDSVYKIYQTTANIIYNFSNIYRYLNFRRYDFTRIYRAVRIKDFQSFTSYFFIFTIFVGFMYVIAPMFFSYSKSDIEKVICKNKNIECSIEGKIYYSFFPTPRIKIKDLKINDLLKEKNILAIIKNATVKLSIKNLINKEKNEFKKIQLNNFEINLNVKNLKKYKNIFLGKNNFLPISFEKGKIILFDGKNYVATIDKVNLDLKFKQSSINTLLKGKFLNDDAFINLEIEKNNNKVFTNATLKLSKMNFLTKLDFVNSEKNKDITNGNFLIKKGKNRVSGLFNYKNDEIVINKSNLRNTFVDGKLAGKIKLLPYFNFNLDLNLHSINFTKLYNSFLALDENSQKNFFRINNKINGKLNLSADKIYSNYNLTRSLESRIKFYNGNISIEQLLLNLGKLGAADILGTFGYDKKFTNFKFESNVFIDNQKKFLSKFGIYNKEKIPSNLFVSGNFDLNNIRATFYEISNDKKFSNDDVNYIEKEFNDFMLEEGYSHLFHFSKFKEFVKSITSDL